MSEPSTFAAFFGSTQERKNDQAAFQFTVAIPAYNEERFIGSMVIQALRYTESVLVIDDGSTDGTAYIAKKAGAQLISHAINQGKSAAVNTALNWARAHNTSAIVFIDGDGQHCTEEIREVLEPIRGDRADMVVGSRFLSIKSKIPAYRQFGQHALTLATNLTSRVKVTDSQSGFRAFSRRAIELLHFTGTGLSVESEMQFKAKEHSLRVVEVPIRVIYQEKAKRNPFVHGLQIASNILRLIGQHRPVLFFGVPGFITLLAGIIMSLWIIDIYAKSHQLAMGYALIAVLFLTLGILSIFVGIILHSVRAFFIDITNKLQSNAHSNREISDLKVGD